MYSFIQNYYLVKNGARGLHMAVPEICFLCTYTTKLNNIIFMTISKANIKVSARYSTLNSFSLSNICLQFLKHSMVRRNITTGLDPKCTHTNNQYTSKPKGLRQIRDHVRKTLGKEKPDKFIFDLYFQNNFPKNVQTKIAKAESDRPCQTLLCQGPRSLWGASVRW